MHGVRKATGESRQLEFSWRHGSDGSETFIDATFHKLSSWLIVLKSEARGGIKIGERV